MEAFVEAFVTDGINGLMNGDCFGHTASDKPAAWLAKTEKFYKPRAW